MQIILDETLTAEQCNETAYNSLPLLLDSDWLCNYEEEEELTINVAPGVYWMHDPDDDSIFRGQDRNYRGMGADFFKEVHRKNLVIRGLSDDPKDVVWCANKGHGIGSVRNFTNFHFFGDSLIVENMTFGNYVSCDLVYPRNPKRNRKARSTSITQGQLGFYDGDRFLAKNCRFEGRLNTDPIIGGRRSLYVGCHFEMTDDALMGHAAFLDCDFDFYGSKPIYICDAPGMAFLHCNFHSVMKNLNSRAEQCFMKVPGPIAVIDCAFDGTYEETPNFYWTTPENPLLIGYMANVTYNNTPITIGGGHTVNLEGTGTLSAYKNPDGSYNIINLVSGEDEWNPLNQAEGKRVPTGLLLELPQSTVTEEEKAELKVYRQYFTGEKELATDGLTVIADDTKVQIEAGEQGFYLSSLNDTDDVIEQEITVKDENGLEAKAHLKLISAPLPVPEFLRAPEIVKGQDSDVTKLYLLYELATDGHRDESDVTWVRETPEGDIVVAQSYKEPLKEYIVKPGDAGRTIKAIIAPKCARSSFGDERCVYFTGEISKADSDADKISIDFKNFPTIRQELKGPGIYTLDTVVKTNNGGSTRNQETNPAEPAAYGITGNGQVGEGFYNQTEGMRLGYTPVRADLLMDSETLELKIDPAKTAGQGLGAAGEFFDVYIGANQELTRGLGLRFTRVNASSCGMQVQLVQFEGDEVTGCSEPVMTSVFLTGMKITLKLQRKRKTEGNWKISAKVTTESLQSKEQREAGFLHEVELSQILSYNPGCGFVIYNSSGAGTYGWQNSVMLHHLFASWE